MMDIRHVVKKSITIDDMHRTLETLEGVLIADAVRNGVTDDMQRGFARYEKLRKLLRPTTNVHESRTAFRLAVTQLAKLVT
jgi:hypothetical protein